jgi:hypothetical protein
MGSSPPSTLALESSAACHAKGNFVKLTKDGRICSDIYITLEFFFISMNLYISLGLWITYWYFAVMLGADSHGGIHTDSLPVLVHFINDSPPLHPPLPGSRYSYGLQALLSSARVMLNPSQQHADHHHVIFSCLIPVTVPSSARFRVSTTTSCFAKDTSRLRSCGQILEGDTGGRSLGQNYPTIPHISSIQTFEIFLVAISLWVALLYSGVWQTYIWDEANRMLACNGMLMRIWPSVVGRKGA